MAPIEYNILRQKIALLIIVLSLEVASLIKVSSHITPPQGVELRQRRLTRAIQAAVAQDYLQKYQEYLGRHLCQEPLTLPIAQARRFAPLQTSVKPRN